MLPSNRDVHPLTINECKITNGLGLPLSSLLEVELHDSETKKEREEKGQGNVHHCDDPQEVVTEAKVICDELRHGLFLTPNPNFDFMLDVTKLGGDQSIQR